MKADDVELLRELMLAQPVAALGTLHKGRPFVSMVPYALMLAEPDAAPGVPREAAMPHFVIHVSRLAMHTQDMLRSPEVSLMVMGPQQEGQMPQATPRFTVQGRAVALSSDSSPELHPLHEPARIAYLARFPESEPMFAFGDFSLVAITPEWVRIVGGFAQATTVMAADFAKAMANGEDEGPGR